MRVLTVTLAVFGGDKKGGGERYATELSRALRQEGIEVDIAIISSMRTFSRQDEPDALPKPMSLLDFFGQVRRADVVHVHQLNTPGFDLAVTACKLFGKPLVLTDHGGGAFTPGRALGGLRLHLIDAAAFVSQWSRGDVDPKGIIKRNTVILGGGDHLPPAAPLEQHYDFGFVGRLLPHKGAHIALEALPEDASLILAGQVRDVAYRQHLELLAVGKRVTFVSDAPDEYVARLFRSVRYLLVPSVESYGTIKYARPELLGLVALEALAVGTPVIGSEVGGLGEVLNAAQQKVFKPGDVEAWRSGLSTALTETRATVRAEDFSWAAVAKRCIAVYKDLCRSSN